MLNNITAIYLLFYLVGFVPCKAQWSLELRGGMVRSRFYGPDADESRFKPGRSFGIQASTIRQKRARYFVGVHYADKGDRVSMDTFEATLNMPSIHVAMGSSIRILGKRNQVGLRTGCLVSHRLKARSTITFGDFKVTSDRTATIKNFDLEISAGPYLSTILGDKWIISFESVLAAGLINQSKSSNLHFRNVSTHSSLAIGFIIPR